MKLTPGDISEIAIVNKLVISDPKAVQKRVDQIRTLAHDMRMTGHLDEESLKEIEEDLGKVEEAVAAQLARTN